MLRVGVVLSGSGMSDGSEIHESVLTLLALDRAGAQAIFMAPNKNQSEVINHLTGQVSRETRNVLVESARIARGQIRDIRDVRAADLDAVIMPGGWGAVKNLSDFCWNGEKCWIDGEVFRLLREMHAAKKPIGAICIAPVLLAKAFAPEKPRLTIGSDKGSVAALEKFGARHVTSRVNEIAVDENLRLVTTPAYMLAQGIAQAASGIERLVGEVIRMAERRIADSAAARVVSRGRRSAADSAMSRIPARSGRQAADSAISKIASRKQASRATRVGGSRAARPNTRRRTVRA